MSTFVLKRNYVLEMPSNYVNIDSEEMEYIDGGAWNFKQKWNSINSFAFIVDGIITVALAAYGIYASYRTLGALMANNARGLIVSSTALALKRAKIGIAASVVSGIYGVLSYFTKYTLGYGLTLALNCIDKSKTDGHIIF